MKRFLHRRPSASMVVAMTALVVALGGTAVAASHLVRGDKLIKKHSLSGNRLKNHTITGAQVNLSKLGKVPSAATADKATSATSASAAVVAGTANNAAALGGAPPSAYEPSAHFVRTGLVTETAGQSATLATFAPFTLTFKCNAGTGAAIGGEIDATSTVANSVAFGTALPTAGTAVSIMSNTPATTFVDADNSTAEFFTPSGQTYQVLMDVGANAAGISGKCFADAVIFAS